MPPYEDGAQLRHNVIGGAFSGLLGRIPTHPIDTVKARLQSAGGEQYGNGFRCFRSLCVEEGVRGLYRGFGVVAVGGTPAACVYLTSYEIFKSWLGGDTAFLGYFAAGMGAEAAACLLFVPVDVVKERLQVQRGVAAKCPPSVSALPPYSGSIDALMTISRTEGLLGLYKGYWATLGSFGPFSALYFVFYEKSKSMLASAEGVANQSDLSVQGTLLSSAGSGSAAALLTNPLDMAKLRFQTQRNMPAGQAASGHLRGLGHALQSIYAEEGFLALFRGAGARVLFHTPNVCVTFTIFEQCRKFAQQVI